MRLTQYLTEKELTDQKAGVIVYYGNEVLLIKPSDPEFGGLDFQLPKGRIDPGESIERTAMREAEEELGLKKSNIKKLFKIKPYKILGLTREYTLTLYGVEVKGKEGFGPSDFEISEKKWFPKDKAVSIIRKSQRKMFINALKKIKL